MSLFHGWAPASPIKVCWSRVRLVAKRWRFAMWTRACVECKTLTFLLVMDQSRLFLPQVLLRPFELHFFRQQITHYPSGTI